jgi:hypothetical protein
MTRLADFTFHLLPVSPRSLSVLPDNSTTLWSFTMRLAAAFPITVLLLGPPASLLADGQNLISNSGFTQDLGGWTADPGASAIWSTLDAAESSTSGSVLLTNVATDPPHYVKLSQCVPVAGPTLGFALRYRFRIPSGQDNPVGAWATISAYRSAHSELARHDRCQFRPGGAKRTRPFRRDFPYASRSNDSPRIRLSTGSQRSVLSHRPVPFQ